ncbi:MAG: ABC transporter substrate binding protein [Thermodesulfobacteriota bacterium]
MWNKVSPPLISLPLLFFCSSLAQEKKVFRIGLTQFTSTLTSEKDQRGFQKALADAGYRERINLIFDQQNAQGSLANAQPAAQKFLREKFDLTHTLGSPNSRATMKLIKEIPVVFSRVTDPKEAGLVPKESLPGTKTGTNVTGVSHRWRVARQLERYTQFLPRAKK